MGLKMVQSKPLLVAPTCYWVAHEIVSTAGAKTRKQLLKKFIEVARICRSLNNLHTAMFILSALSSTPVRRLHASWKLVSARDMETLKELEQLLDISGNMRCYRQAIAEATAPAIPFLPILLKDITFILDGNPTMITSKISTSTSPTLHGTRLHQSHVPPVPFITGNGNNLGHGTTTGTVQLVNFDKFRQLTQYVENAVDMARSVDYSFEHQLLRQARIFRPSSPSLYGSNDIKSQLAGNASSVSGSTVPMAHRGSQSDTPIASGALDHISELVERRLVKASGLYGVQQRVIEVEFSTRAKATNSLWKANGSTHGPNYSLAENVIRSVQGEEEYLMGLSLMCEPSRIDGFGRK
ncbi:MAG: ras guanine nucleotide exchange factor domain-containing protein [Podila humilis]|nr:MAG: ras guanine nucleotide exchange factor domain-containing protein [Podila humilis]